MRLPPLTPDALADAMAYIDHWLAFRQHHLRVPGVQAAVWSGDGLVLSTAHGLADVDTGEALTPEHRFRAASHSKTMTATLLLQLAEQDRLRLDDRLADHLCWLDEDGSPLADRTLFQVLAHVAGISRDSADASHWQLQTPFLDADELRRRVTSEAPVTDADVAFKYSNIGYSLLGQVVEAVSGRPWASQVRTAILDPLDLHHTGPDWSPELDVPFATAYSGLAWADHRVPIDQTATGAMAPATGVYATAADLCRYVAAHLPGDERLLSDASKRRMQRQVATVPGVADEAYALGFVISHLGDHTLVGHGGGWPGHITRTVLDPDARVAISVATNAIDGPASDLAAGVLRLLDLAAQQAARSRMDGDGLEGRRAEAQRFTGRYAWLWGVRDIALLGDRLVMVDPTAVNPTAMLVELEMVDAETLVMRAGPGFGSPGETVRREQDEDGRTTAVWIGGTRTQPIDAVELPERISAAG